MRFHGSFDLDDSGCPSLLSISPMALINSKMFFVWYIAVISTWDVSKPSAAKKSDRDLIKTNVMAIHHGNITAKDTRLFAQVCA